MMRGRRREIEDEDEEREEEDEKEVWRVRRGQQLWIYLMKF